jgi:hypothetical protein
VIPDYAITRLISQGYLVLSWSEYLCSAIKDMKGQDRYVLLKWDGQDWIVVSQ